jgi:hypothetical protein
LNSTANTSSGLVTGERDEKSGDIMYGEEKYCLVAEEAMERTWWDEPAFPGMKSTGIPEGCVVCWIHGSFIAKP